MTISASSSPSAGYGSTQLCVVPAGCRLTPALDGRYRGAVREHLLIDGLPKPATVVYAADLGGARSIAARLGPRGAEPVLIDLHAVIVESLAELRGLLDTPAPWHPHGRLGYWGTWSGLESYLADLGSTGVADGVVMSIIDRRPASSRELWQRYPRSEG